MEAAHAEPCAGLLDGDGRIAGDLPCIHCAYNLRTMLADGVCPECGEAVADSIRFHIESTARWLAAVSGATATLAVTLIGGMTGLVAFTIVITPTVSNGWTSAAETVGALATVLGSILALVALERLTVREPTGPTQGGGHFARWMVRGCLLVLVVCMVSYVTAEGFVTPRTGIYPARTVAESSVILGLVAFAALPPLVSWHIGNLMRRVARPELSRRARLFSLLLVVVETPLLGFVVSRMMTRWSRATEDLADVVAVVTLAAVLCVVVPAGLMLLLQASQALREERHRTISQGEPSKWSGTGEDKGQAARDAP